MSRHTKGPFTVPGYCIYANSTAKAEHPIHAPKRGLIAKAFRREDAKLFAESPAMLSLLKEIDKATYTDEFGQHRLSLGFNAERISELVAKIEGAAA